MREQDGRVTVAFIEATEWTRKLRIGVLLMGSVETAILGFLAYGGVSAAWLVVVGFFFGVVTVSGVAADCMRRLDSGRSYIEQVCHDMEKGLIARS
jgi:hypothetical protein